ncbi:MAG: hypothetical protein OJI67_09930 [Prosthecobacter sp.]|nr:hypothetical protein [Prosthecobacter sp.]
MDTLYLPAHLITPFFQGKPIRYRFGRGEEQTGVLHITVLLDGSCNIQLGGLHRERGTVHSTGQTLSADMLDRVTWDGEKKEFFAIFE